MAPVVVAMCPDGRFDVGPRAAAEYLLMATAPGRRPDDHMVGEKVQLVLGRDGREVAVEVAARARP